MGVSDRAVYRFHGAIARCSGASGGVSGALLGPLRSDGADGAGGRSAAAGAGATRARGRCRTRATAVAGPGESRISTGPRCWASGRRFSASRDAATCRPEVAAACCAGRTPGSRSTWPGRKMSSLLPAWLGPGEFSDPWTLVGRRVADATGHGARRAGAPARLAGRAGRGAGAPAGARLSVLPRTARACQVPEARRRW